MVNKNKVGYIFNSLGGGKYCSDGRIPHEVIDFFKADDGYFYGYLAPYGSMGKGKWDEGEIKNVILFLSIGNKKLQLIAKLPKAKRVIITSDRDLPKYNGHSIKDIFSSQGKQNYYATFRYSKFFVPKKPLVINNEYDGKKINCQKLYVFLDKYKDIHKWVKIEPEAIFEKKNMINILQILKRETDENAISNLICYYFENVLTNPKLILQKILGYKFKDTSNKIKIEREKSLKPYGRADLFIETSKEIIIVENKILSSFSDGQIEKYNKYLENSNKGGKIFCFIPDFSGITVPKKATCVLYSKIKEVIEKNEKNEIKSIIHDVLMGELHFLSQKYLMQYFYDSVYKFKNKIE